MALSECNSTTNTDGMELVRHGSTAFPIASYQDDLNVSDVPWHWHEELEAVYIIEGTLLLSIGESNKLFTVKAGDGFFINSEILHNAKKAGSSNCILHSIVFHPRLVGGSLDSIFWQKYVMPLLQNENLAFLTLNQETPWQKNALELISRVWNQVVQEENGYEFKIRTALSEFLYLLNLHCPASAHYVNSKELRQSERIKQMLQFIHTHYAQEITTAEIAGSIALSPSECLRCFHNTIGTTPIQYLMEYRIQKAAELLEQTDFKISDIAYSCGFREMSYFTKCFRKIKGHTPSEHRKSP